MNFLLTLAYDGTNYCGFQVQPNGRSVAETFQDGLEAVLGSRPDIKGCTPLTILKKKSKHKKASAAPVGAIALTLFSLLHLKPLSRCATAPPRGSGHARKLCGLTKNFPAAPRFRRKQALQMPFSFTTPSVKMGFRNARRRF